ncbi:hypothetical protein HYD_6180 [Candidatus Hydrogenosomobacter endosymbioticus]|uniref:Uncharacterized protein n=1 Tax=Candidatus Hydrogenosomobacter endosymbioticus TaxID=2558174 RepID=A0ABM7V9M0_9PROT|nr:hypothetical protein HYD_6180 [Candidatus Hydrogenosomobacter endosymbioticus]
MTTIPEKITMCFGFENLSINFTVTTPRIADEDTIIGMHSNLYPTMVWSKILPM